MIATALTGLDITVGNLLPSGNLIQSLGSPTKQFKDLYLSNSTIYIGSLQLKDTGGALTVTSSGGGAAVSYARSTDKLSTFASTSSSELATVISDETGSGSLVFGTSPAITTSLTTPSSSFDLINTTATTVNFAKAATTLSIGAATGTTTVNNNMTVTGNLTVSGTTTTVSSTTLDVADLNITVAKGAADSSSANGAGITVDGAGATITYSHTGTKWVLNKPTSITSNVNSTSATTGTLIVTGGIGASGNIYSSGDITATNFYALSDLALKQNVVNIENPMAKLMGISGVSFKWKKNKSKAVGIIAQDVEKVLPEAVSTDGQGYKVVSYDSLIPLLIESVKSLKTELDLLKKKNK